MSHPNGVSVANYGEHVYLRLYLRINIQLPISLHIQNRHSYTISTYALYFMKFESTLYRAVGRLPGGGLLICAVDDATECHF